MDNIPSRFALALVGLVLLVDVSDVRAASHGRLVQPPEVSSERNGLAMVRMTDDYKVVATEMGYQFDEPMVAGASQAGGSNMYLAKTTECSDLVIAVYLRHQTQLSDGMVAYLCEDDLLVPLQDIVLMLEFAIKVSPNGASGWFLQEDRSFKLDIASRVVVVNGTSYPLKPTETKYIEDSLFVSARGLSRWLPLELTVNLREQSLDIIPKEKLPMEQRTDRANKRFGSININRGHLPSVDSPYAPVQIPAIHTDLSVGYSDRKTQSKNNLIANGTIRAFGDLGYMNSHSWVSASENRVNNAYMRLGRTDPDGNLLGPLAATSWEIGDVSSTSVPLVATTLSGRGAHLSSRASSFVGEFDRITLEDTLPSGYEVELYRNDILINAQRTSDNGKYRFENVLLLRGQNDLRLEFYGPQGQRYTENKSYFVDNNRVSTGAFNYDLSITELGRSVFGINDHLSRNYSANPIGGSAQIDYGLNPDLSLTGGVLVMPLRKSFATTEHNNDQYRHYANLGARTQLLGVGLALDSAFDDVGGKALSLNANSQLAQWNINLGYSHYLDNFISGASYSSSSGSIDSFGVGELLRSQTLVGIQRNFYDAASRLSFNLGLRGSYATYVNGNDIKTVTNNVGLSYGIVSVSNSISYLQSYSNNSTNFNTSLNLRLPYDISLRASAYYKFDDNLVFNQYSLGLNAALSERFNLSINYFRQPDDPQNVGSFSQDGYFASLTRDFAMVQLGLQLSHINNTSNINSNVNDGFIIAATISFDLFADSHSGTTKISSKSIAGQGAIRTHAFLDDNANGIRDPDESLLGGVGVISSAYRSSAYTTSDKEVIEPEYSVPTERWLDVRLDPNNMPDPTFAPGSPGVAVLPRPGVVSEVELAVVTAADIEGTVTLKSGEIRRPLPNIRVQVIRKEKTGAEIVVAEAYTESDGFYTLTGLPIGNYVAQVFPEQVKLLSAIQPAPRKFSLVRDTGLLEHVDIELVQEAVANGKQQRNRKVVSK